MVNPCPEPTFSYFEKEFWPFFFFLFLATTDYKGKLLGASTWSDFWCLTLKKELENCINKSENYLLNYQGEIGTWNISADANLTELLIKVTITSNKKNLIMNPDVPKKGHSLTSVVYLPKMYNLNIIIRKVRQIWIQSTK